jgi:hypothetical protein
VAPVSQQYFLFTELTLSASVSYSPYGSSWFYLITLSFSPNWKAFSHYFFKYFSVPVSFPSVTAMTQMLHLTILPYKSLMVYSFF